MKRWQKMVGLWLVSTAVHFVLALSLMLISFGQSMARFDNPTLTETTGERLLTAVVNILWQPMLFVTETFFSAPLPNALEWGLLVLNSLLWGGAVVLLGVGATAVVRKRSFGKTQK